jgi:hypothetical protein
MGRPLRLLKFSLVFLVLMAATLRPIIVFAQNSHNHSMAAIVSDSRHQAPFTLIRHSAFSGTMRILDKEKVNTVCLTPCFQKECARLEPRSFQIVDAAIAVPLSLQFPILRI